MAELTKELREQGTVSTVKAGIRDNTGTLIANAVGDITANVLDIRNRDILSEVDSTIANNTAVQNQKGASRLSQVKASITESINKHPHLQKDILRKYNAFLGRPDISQQVSEEDRDIKLQDAVITQAAKKDPSLLLISGRAQQLKAILAASAAGGQAQDEQHVLEIEADTALAITVRAMNTSEFENNAERSKAWLAQKPNLVADFRTKLIQQRVPAKDRSALIADYENTIDNYTESINQQSAAYGKASQEVMDKANFTVQQHSALSGATLRNMGAAAAPFMNAVASNLSKEERRKTVAAITGLVSLPETVGSTPLPSNNKFNPFKVMDIAGGHYEVSQVTPTESAGVIQLSSQGINSLGASGVALNQETGSSFANLVISQANAGLNDGTPEGVRNIGKSLGSKFRAGWHKMITSGVDKVMVDRTAEAAGTLSMRALQTTGRRDEMESSTKQIVFVGGKFAVEDKGGLTDAFKFDPVGDMLFNTVKEMNNYVDNIRLLRPHLNIEDFSDEQIVRAITPSVVFKEGSKPIATVRDANGNIVIKGK